MARPRRRRLNKNPRQKVSRRVKRRPKRITLPANGWDKRLTLAQNYEQAGLTVRLNAGLSHVEFNKKVNQVQAANVYKQEILGETDNIFEELDMLNNALPEPRDTVSCITHAYVPFNEERPAPVRRHLSESEAVYLRALVRKYGADVEAMSRDIKQNYLQMTPGVLRKKLSLLQDE